MDENPQRLAKLKTIADLVPGISLKCNMIAYTKIEIRAQVSFGSHAQYLPQLSLAQTPPKNVPTVNRNSPMVIDSSLTEISSF